MGLPKGWRIFAGWTDPPREWFEMPTTRVWVNDARTLLVTVWPDGQMSVSVRESPDHVWGPPVRVTEEKT
jgi:hypothetical protein